MYNTTVIYFMSIALIACGGIFVIKNFLVNYRASDNGIKNVAVILLTVFAVISALTAAADAWHIEGLMDKLQHSRSIDAKLRQLMEGNIADYSSESIVCIISGYIMFIAAYFICRNIEQEICKDLDKPKERWDWSKITKKT